MSFSFSFRSVVGLGVAALALLVAFSIGIRFNPSDRANTNASAPKILYYQDPMHPSYRSNVPGKAPDCGMDLEPVYGPTNVTESELGVQHAAAVQVSPGAAALMGLQTVKVISAQSASSAETIGKIVADESRIYKVTALAEGVVRYVAPLGTGSLVRRDDRLATYFVPTRDLYNAVQAYVLASGTYDQVASSVHDSAVLKASKSQARVEEELLKSYGLSVQQIRDLARTREVTRDIDFRSPVSGIVLERSVSDGQTVLRGAELFRIADLHHVWALADVYERDANLFQAGRLATVTYGSRSYRAVVAAARDFDPTTRTLKVRLELENPDQILRPEMFVGIKLAPSSRGSALSVPTESLLDTGSRKVVFVALADGGYEPREVTVGREANGSTEILSGLDGGEDVVTHGAFLLDSESRLQTRTRTTVKMVAAPDSQAPLADPVCGMPLHEKDAALTEEFAGRSFSFCSRRCKAKFDADRARYAGRTPAPKLQTSL